MELRTEIRDRLRRARDWSQAIEELEKDAEQLDNDAERSERLYEIAQASEEIVPERDRALAIYQRAWKTHPQNLKALARARQVYRDLGRLEMVAKVGELELKVVPINAARGELAALVGEALLDSGERDRAVPVLRMALEAMPESWRVKDALAAAEYDPDLWLDVVERLSSEADKADSLTAARMLLRAARMVRLETPEDPSCETLLARVLAFDPQNESGNFLYEALLAKQERWAELEKHHDKRAYAAADDATRSSLYRKFALEWVQRFRDRERGARFFAKAIESASQNGHANGMLVSQVVAFTLFREIYGGKAEWPRILKLADAVLPYLDDDQKLFVALQAATIAWRELNDVASARRYFEVVRDIEPASPDLADFDAQVPVGRLERPPTDFAKTNIMMAVLPEDLPEDVRNEIGLGSAPIPIAPALAPAPTPALAPAPAAPVAAARPAPAPAALAAAPTPPAPAPVQAVPAAPDPGAPAPPPPVAPAPAAPAGPESISPDQQAAMQAAREAEGAGPDKAIDAWRKAVAKDPSKRGPRRELARVIRAHERWNALIEALKDEEQHAAKAPADKAAILHEMVAIYRDRLRLDVMVVNTLNQILTLEPDNVEVLDTLAAQYEAMKRWPDLVATLAKKAPRVADPAERAKIHLRVANLYLEKFSNQAEAIKAFEAVLEIDRDNREAIGHLEAVYEKRRDWEKLIALREGEIDRVADPGERARKTYEVAQMAAQKLKKPAVCIKWWAKVLEFSPTHDEALTELEKLYERDKSWDLLANVSARRASAAADPKAKADALQKLGLLYTDKLNDTKQAIKAWRALLEVDPAHRRAQDSLKKLYITDRAWSDLEAFYRGQGKLDEYVRVLERQIELKDEEEPDKLQLAMKIAVMYRDELDKADRAMRAFEKVLSLDATNLEAAEALIPLYETGRDPKKLVGVLEIQLDKTTDPALRQERLKRLAEFSEEKLRDKGAAYGWWLKAHAEDHEAESIHSQVERLAQDTGGFAELVAAYEASYRKFPDRAAALPLMLVVARVQEKELGEVDKALATNRAILAIDDANPAAVEALERLYLGKQMYQELLDIYRRKLDLTLDADLRTQIQYKIGQLYEEEIKDDRRAVEAYKAILDANGDEPDALAALDRIYAKSQRFTELADILVRELVLVDPERQRLAHVELKFRLGQVREANLGDGAGAVECYRDILELEPGHAGARAALERRLADPAHRLAAAGILEPIYEHLEEWPRLIEVHEIQLAAEQDLLRRSGLLMRIGELHSKKLGDAEKAFDAFARCFREDPSHEGARIQLEELGSLLDDGWAKLVALFEAAISGPEAGAVDPKLAHELALKIAAAYDERLDDTAKAVEYFKRALAIEPEDLTAIDALDRLFTRDEKYPELLEVYRRKVEIAGDPRDRLNILFRIASIHEEMLQSPDEAISTYNEILGHDPDNVPALRALDKLYVERAQWRDLGDNLTRQLALSSDKAGNRECVTLLVRLAQLRETRLNELAAAVETYRDVLELESAEPSAIAALERLIGVKEHELTIAQILEPIYQAHGAWDRQIGVYEIMARHAFDPARRIELLRTIAELYELGGDDGVSAFASYARALREEPRDETTQAQLDRLARMLEKWGDLVVLYDQIVAEVADDELKVQLLGKLAQIHALELGDDERAVATYGRILEVSPSHLDAASAIQAIHERNSDYPALVAALKRKSEIVLALPERKALLYKAAQIEEEVLESADGAIATFRSVLALDDIDRPAMDALERLYIRLERWEPLKDVYAKKADLADNPDDKKQMLYVLGQVFDRELGDVAKAIETYQAILDLDPDELAAIQSLDRLYGQAERWYDLLQNLERQVELADSTGESVGLKYRIGQLWQHKLHDLARAIDAYREALALNPNHDETINALDGLLHGDGEPVLAARVLEPIYDASLEFERLIDVLEVMVKHAEDPVARVELLHRIAELNEYRLERLPQALAAYARALREDSGNEVSLGHLERLADATRAWRDLAALYAVEAEKSMDVPRQVDLLSRLARIYEEELGLQDDAIMTFRRIVDVEFDNRPAVLALDRLYAGSEQWNRLAEILRKEIQLAATDQEIAGLQFRLGQVLEQNLRDLRGAIGVYREILAADPAHVTTLSALEMLFLEGQHELEIAAILEPLYASSGQFEKLHKIHEVQLSKLTAPSDRMAMYQRLAELAEEKLFDAARAFRWWGLALIEDPRSDLAGHEVERLAKSIAAWDDLVDVYLRVLERHTGPDVQRVVLLRLARVYDGELGDAVRATETYLRALEIDPRDPEALAALDKLYETAGMYDELVEILRRRIEITLDGDEQVQLHFRRGHVFSEALADLDEALACYERVLEQDTRNRTALEAEEHIYFRREDWPKLYTVYERLVDVATGEAELGDIYAHSARLASDALADEEKAIELWGRVLDIRGEDPVALFALAELYERRGLWNELVEVIEREVRVTEADADQIALYKRLGGIWADKLGRERNALEAWLHAYQIDPSDLETLRALAHLYRATQSWEELSQTLRRILDVGQLAGALSEDETIELYAQLGQLEGELLGRVNAAVEAWRRVLSLDPTDFRALAALEQLFTREARWEECIDVLEKRAAVLDDEAARIETLLQAAAIWEEKVEDKPRAAEVYERVRGASSANQIASAQLEAIYRSQYNWEKLTEILLERVEHKDDVNDRIDILQTVAKIYEEEIGDQDAAFVVLQAAFREDYAHEGTSKELERLATATGKWQELLADYTQVVQGLETENKDSACDLWVKIGRWYGDHLSHVDYAIHSVSQALRLDPNHLGALGALADFQRKRGSWGELIETLGRHAAIEPDPGKKVDLYLSLAELLETQVQDPGQAMGAYQAALQADPATMDALVALDRLYRRHEMWEPLIDVLSRMSDLRTEPEAVVKLKLEIGRLWDEMLFDPGQAISAFRDVLTTDPHNLPALRALERLYEKTGQSEQYLDILEAQLDASPTDAEQIALYERMASAWEERFGKLDRAAECLEKIVAIDERRYGAYRELARLYRQENKWESLVDVYRRNIMAAGDPGTRVDLYCAMGQIYEQELGDTDRAIESYTDVLSFDPDEPRALDALGRLYERIEEWERAIQFMAQLVETTDHPAKKVELYHRIGRITYANLGDSEGSESQFLNALTLNAAHVPSMEALVRLYSDRGDWMKAAQMMVRAESHTANALDKVRLLYDAARIYLEKLDQPTQAKQLLAAVIALDPEHVAAGEPLAELYFEAEQWRELEPVMDMLVRKAGQLNKDARALNELYFRTARTADELGRNDKALQYYKAAYDIDSTYLPTLLGRADLLYKMQDWDGAGKIYQTILVQHRDSQREADVVRIYHRLGKVRFHLGERKKALNMFEKALEIDPHHSDTLNSVIEIQQAVGDWEAVIHAKRALLKHAESDLKVDILDEIGGIYHTKLQNAQKGIAAYLEALEVRPSDHSLLQKVLDLYVETKQWKKAVEVMLRFAEMESDPLRRGKYYQAAGVICRDEVKALDESIDYFNLALDGFFQDSDKIPKSLLPGCLKAFADIDKILTSKRDWKAQERAYRQMIKRLKPGDKILVDLWHALGEIYRSRLKQVKSAVAAFEVAAQLDPGNKQRHEILAELYVVAGPDYADKAVAEHMMMLKAEPFKYDSYKALRRIYMDSHQYDKTWCVCNTLAFLKKADPEEMQFYEQYKPRGFVKAKQRMTEEVWRKVVHPDEDRMIGSIFAAIWQGAALVRAHPHKALGLKRKDRRQIETDQLQFSKIFYYVSQVLNVPLPEVYLQAEQPGEIVPANCEEKGQLIPSFVVRANLLQGRPEKEIAFASARKLTMMRPEHYLKMVLPTNTELKTAFMSAIVLVKRDFPLPADMQALVAQYLPVLMAKIQPQWLEQLGIVVSRFLQQAAAVDLVKWGNGVDATGHRIGFILCGDLEVAARLVSMEPVVVGGPQVKDKIKELVLYSISEDYFFVRSHLGTTIG